MTHTVVITIANFKFVSAPMNEEHATALAAHVRMFISHHRITIEEVK